MQHSETFDQAMRLMQAHAESIAHDDPPPLSRFRMFLGIIMALLAAVFLACNMVILGHFGWRLGNSIVENYVQMICAAAVPVLMTLIPPIYVATWVPGHMTSVRGRTKWRRGRPNWGWLLGVTSLMLVAIAINFAGGIGVMSTARKGVALKADDAKKEDDRLTFRREMLAKEIQSVPEHRPTDTVIALLAAHRLHRFWKTTDQCNSGSVLNKGHRDYCGEHERLKGEQSSSEKANKLKAELAEVDQLLTSPLRSSLQAEDAQVETISHSLNLTPDTVRNGLSLLFPALLELMALLSTSLALKFFRIDHRTIQDVPRPHDHHPSPARMLPAPMAPARKLEVVQADQQEGDGLPRMFSARHTPVSEDPLRQRAILEEFWSTRVRRVASGQVPEATIYSHYQVLSAQRGVLELDIETFRRMSSEHIQRGGTVRIGGVVLYCQIAVDG